MKRNILSKSLGFLVLLAVFFSSCGSKRNASKGVNPAAVEVDNTVKSFEMSNLTFHTFSGRAKAKVELDGDKHDATAHIRMDRDKAIWISITSLFNIEVARVLITPDSVKILNKFPRRELIEKPFSYIYQYVNEGMSFRTLQDILVGNVSTELLRSEQVQIATSDDEEVIVIGSKGGLAFQYGMTKFQRPYATIIEDRQVDQQLDVAYNQYSEINGHVFPQRFVLHIAGDGLDIKADLEYNRLTFNERVDMPF